MRKRRSVGLVALTVVLATLLAGCVSVPRSGNVVRAGEPTTRASSAVEIAPRPPEPDASPRQVVEGFLQAMAAYEPDYLTAYEYLTDEAAERWEPGVGVTVYANGFPVTAREGKVELAAPITGRVDERGVYRPVEDDLRTDFAVVRDAEGQWRISQPPEGLLVSQFIFENFFEPVHLYWSAPQGGFLVPDPVFMQAGRRSPTALVQSLLAGPTPWIDPAVESAIPPGTTLNEVARVDDDGVVTVDLSGDALGILAADQRRVMVGQLTWTLSQMRAVSALRLLHDGEEYTTDVAQGNGLVPIASVPHLAPVPGNLDNHLFSISGGSVHSIDQADQGVSSEPLPGAAGQPVAGRSSLAVTTSGDGIAVVNSEDDTVTTYETATGTQTFNYHEIPGVLRPQYSRYDELWLVSGQPGAQRIRVGQGTELREVAMGELADREIHQFRLSPDGVRIALVLGSGEDRVLAIARVERDGDGVAIGGLRELPLATTSQTRLTHVADVGWIGPGSLVVMGAGGTSTELSPYRLDQSAAVVQQIGQTDRWEGSEIAALPGRDGVRLAIVGTRGGMWRYEDDFAWTRVADGITAAAYPG